MQERPTSLEERETLAPEPPRAGDEGAVAAATAQSAPGNMVPVLELSPSEEYGDSEEIDLAAAASAAAWIAEFISASEAILGAGTSEGPSHGANWAVVQSSVPSDFAHAEREEGDAWRAHRAIRAQIEENLSRALNLFLQANLNVSCVSVLFAHFRFCEYNFYSCFLICSSCYPCHGTRVIG